MESRKLSKIRQNMERLRQQGGVKSIDLQSLARTLGREQHKRGKEPTWVNHRFPDLRPLSIPSHGSRDLNRFTAGGILDQLELDLERWEEEIGPEENDEDN